MVASHISVIYIHIWVSLIYDVITKQLVSSSNEPKFKTAIAVSINRVPFQCVYTVKM